MTDTTILDLTPRSLITSAIKREGVRTNDHRFLSALERIAEAAAQALDVPEDEMNSFVLEACPWLW